MSRIIALISGKSGVGKTHLSVNLALQCAHAGLRTCIFDADPGPANAHQLLKLTPQHTLADALAGRCQMRDVVQSGYGIDIVSGSFAVERTADLPAEALQRLREAFGLLVQYDLILFDVDAHATENMLAFATAAPEILLVITPEPAALTDAYALVKRLQRQRYAGRIQVVVNQTRSERQAVHTYEKFRGVVRVYQGIDLALMGAIPVDSCMDESGDMQMPLSILRPDSCAGLALAELAVRLLGEMPAGGDQHALSDFWSRLTGLEIGPLPATPGPELSLPVPAAADTPSQGAISARLDHMEAQLAQVTALLALNAQVHSAQQAAAHATPPPKPMGLGPSKPVAQPLQPLQPRRRAGEAPQLARGLRAAQRSTPIDALQLRRVVGRMLVKAMPDVQANAPATAQPVQIAIDQIQLEGNNEFNLRAGRYSRISLHCTHIKSPDLFVEEIFANCAITGCKVRHLGSHVRYWVTSGRDGCILLDGDVDDRNCVQVYMAAGGNSPLEAVGSELEAMPKLRRAFEGMPGAMAPGLLLSKFPHERLPYGEADEGIALYRLLRRDREPLLCAFHHTGGETAAESLREHSPA